jgi:outer membrane receptor protein involved in Fe transport
MSPASARRLLAALALLSAPSARAQSAGLEQLSLEELLAEPVSVASFRPQAVRDAPGVLSVVSREEIAATGARDLMDVLRRVPGFSFGVDVAGVVGPSFRGNWGNEAKVLLLVDGQVMNELLYGSLQFGNHYPVEHVERVEVIRGPGSVMYGGEAELAVINVITRSASVSGLALSATGGLELDGPTRGTLSAQYGQTFGELAVSAAGYLGRSMAGTGDYRNVYGEGFPMRGNADQAPAFLNASARWRGASLRLVLDGYRVGGRDGLVEVHQAQTAPAFRSALAELRYELPLTDALTLTPRLSVRQQTPWLVEQVDSEAHMDTSARRLLAGVTASWRPAEWAHLLAGVEGARDDAWLNSFEFTGVQRLFGGVAERVDYASLTGFAQAELDTPLARVTAGARAERHSQFGGAFVPRLGLTRTLGRFHGKLLYSEAYRAPSIINVSLQPDIRPERTRVLEAEAGFQVTDHLLVVANAYDVTIRQPILYFYDGAAEREGYLNAARSGSRGAELEARLKLDGGFLHLAYGFYSAAGKNAVEDFAVPGREDVMLGAPAHKASMSGSVRLAGGYSLGGTAVFQGPSFAYTSADAEGNLLLSELAPTFTAGLFLQARDLAGVPGLEGTLGVHDLLDQRAPVPQPYAGGHTPMPGMGRELLLRLGYTLPLGG